MLSFVLIIAGCIAKDSNISSNINEQDSTVYGNSETALNEMKERYRIADSERIGFRSDMEDILELLKQEGKIPFYGPLHRLLTGLTDL